MAGLMALLALPLVLAGCDDASPKAQAAPAAQTDQARQAQRLAQAKLREDLRADLAFSEVRTFPQAVPGTLAVCGQVALPGGQKAPFVSFVTLRSEEGQEAEPVVEQHVATDAVSATRVYVETRTRCTDKADMAAHRVAAPPVLPAIPADLRTLAPPAPARVAKMEAEAGQARAQAGIAMRQNGNLRTSPNGGGEVIRVVPRGATLQVFSEAPGGWLQVGKDAPEGWMHATMVTRMTREDAASLTTAAR
jgi:hypothetical protein